MKRKWTEGPWWHALNHMGHIWWICAGPKPTRGEKPIRVAEVLGATREADARLIAAAPELAEALQAFVDAAESWHRFHHGTEIQCDELCAAIPAGKAALQKAEGQAEVIQ